MCFVNQTMMCISIAHWFKADTVVWNRSLVHSAEVAGSHMPATVMIAWTYINHTLQSTAMLYDCNGRVRFQSRQNITDWHGSWMQEVAAITLKFHHDGDENKLRSAHLLVHEGYDNEVYWLTGFDYAGRAISMELRSIYVYDDVKKSG